jgi:hypothetical protein
MCTMRPAEVVEIFPSGQFFLQIYIVRIGKKLIELLSIGSM